MITRRDVLVLALGAMSGARAEQAPLHIVTAHLPPLVMSPGDRQPGALRELVDALCKRLGLAPDIEFMPWRRALYVATTAPHTAIFPVTRLPEREGQFRWLAPLYEENYIFLAQKGSDFDVQRPQDMKERRIALLRGAAQAAILRDLGFERLVEASSIDEVHRFLLAGMADAAFGERAIIHRSLEMRGEEKNFRLGRPVRSTTAWLAGSLDIGERDAARWRAAMAELVADGTQKRIFRQYGLA
ncbi:transporter substrate-binding domain-containing protein [Telluria mixta]|uniref:Transporter substrate-binding domain-containing protein n=1 Tax=Telluria mixta TaxID=34071 RepID=A0ABT2BY56_9BURK|nr:transporter substrate-binding domain-containing protein [Telluria mixta]MCS0630060.1 transporter substrate-binding domain-containing protein [Telluria mixta]WEM94627.1 transporter substrate-binding domain-containing protein [Telluria mixta]